jgi:ferric-dicitrate binding protein FerR (iron transport regulator)
MIDEAIRLLWSKHLSGEALSESERRRLAEAMGNGDALRDEAELDGLLRGLGSFAEDPETFGRSFREFLAAKRSETDFLRKIQARTEQLKRRKPASPSSTWRTPALIAAAVIAIAVLVYILTPASPDQPRAAAPERKPRKETPPRREDLPKTTPEVAKDPAPKREPRKSPEELQAEKERIEREMRDAVARAQAAATPPKEEKKSPEPDPAPPRPPEPKPPSPDPGTSRITGPVVARVETVEGEAFFVTQGTRLPAKAGASLSAGQGLETGAATSRAVLVFPDRTRVELGPETAVEDVKTARGKQITVTHGRVLAEVAKQPKDQPLIFRTPHGEAKVVGTTLRLVVDADPRKGTRVEVDEGKVELKNLANRTVMVESGHGAVAAAGVAMVAAFRELSGWLLYVRSDAGTLKFGAPAELVDDPLEAGHKCFRLKYASNFQGLVLPLALKIPVEDFDGVSFEAYVPVNSPKGCVIASDARDSRNLFASTDRQTPKRGAWQKVQFQKGDYKLGDPLSGFVTHVYVSELTPDFPANATPEHEFYLRRIQVRRSK